MMTISHASLLSIHLFAVAFWFGVVGVEFILERGRALSKEHGYKVADIHHHIDMYLEMPAFMVVLITGVLMLDISRLDDGLYLLKISAGFLAVIGNIYCVYPIIKRKLAAQNKDIVLLKYYSKLVDKISLVAIPAGVIALVCGIYLQSS